MRYKELLLLKILFFVIFSPGFCLSETIKFAPLPLLPKEVLIGNYLPLIELIKKKTGLPLEIYYERDYLRMLADFKAGKIHIITAGPLPYVLLKKEYPHAEAILHFKEGDGTAVYDCTLFTSHRGPDNIKGLKGPVALPQKISTCGYFSASIILSSEGKNLDKMGYTYFETHHEVAEAVIRGTHEAGCLKSDIAEKYRGFAIKFLKRSPKWPSFSIIVNTKVLNPEQIKKIKLALINLQEEEAKNLIAGKHGFVEAKERDFEIVKKYERHFPKD
ncbi:MAG: PhnD/SsuA/transferrin family substrate-binding protein [Caldimicrobium sp.]|nr:PhnD/SsuA/transferrin family substrate-binding protein [Caldimicrobium sp.]